MQKRVLIFGAYANGNIGDMYQANSVGYHLERHRPDWDVYSTSNSSAAAPYEFSAERQLDHAIINDTDIVNGYKALFVGGGGLLASVHRPLQSAEWVKNVRIPIVLLGIGASPEVAETCRAVIEAAQVVTARDDYSLEVLKPYRSDVTLLNDPILMDDRLDRGPQREDVEALCIIPRKQTEKNRPVYEHLAKELGEHDTVLSMFPKTDQNSGALKTLGASEKTIEAWTMQQMTDAIDSASYLASERYHGAILSLKRSKPCLGLINSDGSRSKIGELYRQVGHEHLLVAMRGNPHSRQRIIDRLNSEFDCALVSSKLNAMKRDFDTQMSVITKAI